MLRTTPIDSALLRAPRAVLGQADAPTADETASVLLSLREALSASWPKIRARAASMTDDQRAQWNAVVWQLQDLELRLLAGLRQAGVRSEAGELLDPNVIGRRLPVGMFSGEAPLGLLPAIPLAAWALTVLGVSIVAGAGALIMSTIDRKELDQAEQTAAFFAQAVAAGVPPEVALERIAGAERERHRRPMPPWAKGLIGASVAVAIATGAWVAYRRWGRA